MITAQDMKTSENDITASLKPLIDEYFCGETTVENNKIIYTTQSGQTFRITVTQA